MTEHKTVPVRVIADIDERIAPLVGALNSISDVRTYASCEGTGRPYDADVIVGWLTEAAALTLGELVWRWTDQHYTDVGRSDHLADVALDGYSPQAAHATLRVKTEVLEAYTAWVIEFLAHPDTALVPGATPLVVGAHHERQAAPLEEPK